MRKRDEGIKRKKRIRSETKANVEKEEIIKKQNMETMEKRKRRDYVMTKGKKT